MRLLIVFFIDMAKIMILNKRGDLMETIVEEDVETVWMQLCGSYDTASTGMPYNRDFVKLTHNETKQPMVFQKRYIFQIQES